MRPTFLPFAPPSVGEDEIQEVVATLRSGWLTTGPKVRRFEEDFAAFVGAPEALATNSCSAALHAALHVSRIGAGDAVITTPLTFAATAHAIEHVGARVVFADVEPDTLNLSPASVNEAIDRATRAGYLVRALLPVHYAGHPCDMQSLESIAADRDLVVVEDAAHALPARIEGRIIGGQNVRSDVRTFTAFSFYANKNLTTGEGGMLIGPKDSMSAARAFCHHGIDRDNGWRRDAVHGMWRYEIVDAGFKYGMTDLAASLGIHQLRRLPESHKRRRLIAARYLAGFDGLAELEMPAERPGTGHGWHLFVVRLNLDRLRIDRDRFLAELEARRIGASVHFLPLHMQPYYRDRQGLRPDDMPVAWSAWPRLLSLPIHPGLTDDDVDDVIGAVHDVCRTHRR
ncbi:MAG: DegT/DnrJ/EryC1/StrS family aminotransferase [Planctomycetes bacterium]|nr:DegT/DnrJ/EryC1/StrS family aminotransferase [Planctomycetota bacterium]